MAENRVEFRYTAGDVTSAQRMRMLKSGQWKGILVFWVASVLFLSAHILFPQVVHVVNDASWALIGEVTLIYIVTVLVLLYITPFLDFAFNRVWRLGLALIFNDKQLRLTLAKPPKKTKGGKTASGLVLVWSEILKVLENRRVFVVIYGPQSKFFVVPKSAFTKPGMEERFRQLATHPAASVETPAEKKI